MKLSQTKKLLKDLQGKIIYSGNDTIKFLKSEKKKYIIALDEILVAIEMMTRFK